MVSSGQTGNLNGTDGGRMAKRSKLGDAPGHSDSVKQFYRARFGKIYHGDSLLLLNRQLLLRAENNEHFVRKVVVEV